MVSDRMERSNDKHSRIRQAAISTFYASERRVVLFRLMLPTAVLFRVLLWSVLIAAYSGLAVWKEHSSLAEYIDFSAGLEAALSLAIGLLLAFRVNRAFDRWWEGRILWGTLVNACRNLAVKANNVVAERDDSINRLERLITAFPFALRDHLRGGAEIKQTPGLEDERFTGKHLPSWIANQIYGIFEVWKREQRIQYGEFWMLDREAKVLLEICGACERIRNTPIAPSYRVILYHAVACFLLTLPWGIVNEFGYLTIPIVFLTSYFVIAAEELADHIEQPFDADGDGLDLDGICAGIEASVHEILATETAAKREA
jgi:putative membrane protein